MMLSKKQIGMVALSVITAILIPLTSIFVFRIILSAQPTVTFIKLEYPGELSNDATQEQREEYNQKINIYKEKLGKEAEKYDMLGKNIGKFYFYTAFCVGLVSIIFGALVVPVDFFGAGCIFGGIFTLILGYMVGIFHGYFAIRSFLFNLTLFLSLLGILFFLFVVMLTRATAKIRAIAFGLGIGFLTIFFSLYVFWLLMKS